MRVTPTSPNEFTVINSEKGGFSLFFFWTAVPLRGTSYSSILLPQSEFGQSVPPKTRLQSYKRDKNSFRPKKKKTFGWRNHVFSFALTPCPKYCVRGHTGQRVPNNWGAARTPQGERKKKRKKKKSNQTMQRQ